MVISGMDLIYMDIFSGRTQHNVRFEASQHKLVSERRSAIKLTESCMTYHRHKDMHIQYTHRHVLVVADLEKFQALTPNQTPFFRFYIHFRQKAWIRLCVRHLNFYHSEPYIQQGHPQTYIYQHHDPINCRLIKFPNF